MIANDNRIKGRTVDYTWTLEFLAGYLMGPGCRVVLDEQQFEVLKAYLAHIEAVGEDTNFQLEMCVDYRDHATSAGYSVAWDNDGSLYQDDLIETIMEQMTQSLGFTGGSIIREGYLIDLADIDQQIGEIKARVLERSRQAALDSVKPWSDGDPTFKSPPPRLTDQGYSDLTDLKRSWIISAHRCDAPADWIADQLNLPVETVEKVISDFVT